MERFRSDTADLWPLHEKLALAVSGGPDSIALLLLAHALRPDAIEAATVDHGLRAESADEAAMVGQLCQNLGVAHRILPVALEQGNIQSEARKARYAALEGWMDERGLLALATAHHADDQVETFLMRLNRGSGVGGLAGIRRNAKVPGGAHRLIRPLLDWRKSDLVDLVRAAGIDFAQDPSNNDLAYDRARLRSNISDAAWLDIESIARSVTHLAEADATLDWMTAHEWDRQVKRIGKRYVYRPAAPRAIRLRIVTRLIGKLGGNPRGSAAARLVDGLESGEGGNLAGVLVTNVGGAWRFEAEPPRKTG